MVSFKFHRMRFTRVEGLGVILGGVQFFRTDLIGLPKVEWSLQGVFLNCCFSVNLLLRRRVKKIRCGECKFWRKREDSKGPGIATYGSCTNPKSKHAYTAALARGCMIAEFK